MGEFPAGTGNQKGSALAPSSKAPPRQSKPDDFNIRLRHKEGREARENRGRKKQETIKEITLREKKNIYQRGGGEKDERANPSAVLTPDSLNL